MRTTTDACRYRGGRWTGVYVPLVILAVACPGIAEANEGAEPVDRRDVPHLEPALLPTFGLSSDTGVLLGSMVQLARFKPGQRPYAWRLQAQLAASIKDGPQGWELPFHDDYLRLDVPSFPSSQQRFGLRLGYQKYTGLGYYGFGNRSAVTVPSPDASGGRYTSFSASILTLEGILQQNLWSPIARALFKLSATWRQTDSYADSLLAADAAQGAIEGMGDLFSLGAGAGILLDTRDHETFPTRGMFHDALVSVTPPGVNSLAYTRFTITTRFYWAPLGRHMVLAFRVLGDVLTGTVPFSQEASYGGLQGATGPGGMNAVRGVPVGRFIGKTKVIGNLEVRSLPLRFAVASQRFEVGAAAFFDAGRVWTGALTSDSARDGTGLGMHVGLGGGPRIRWGDSFLLRFDVAYAPEASPSGRDGALGFYITGDTPF